MGVGGYHFVDLLDFGRPVPAPHPHGRTFYIGTDILVRASNVDEDTAKRRPRFACCTRNSACA